MPTSPKTDDPIEAERQRIWAGVLEVLKHEYYATVEAVRLVIWPEEP